ncbi:MAG: hypothetical protein KTR24_11660, partial [Saprospiraceae bacterium]|nr:hypothetical protein [Saprospiraceae bacterium]
RQRIQPSLTPSYGLPSVIDLVESRSLQEITVHGHGLFLKKGFIGQSFHIDRLDFMDRLTKTLDAWQRGFRGSLLIYGHRLSGRTSLIESLLGERFPHPTIFLRPHSTIELRGRKLTCSADLDEALTFINKHNINQRTIVLIDDLELWRDADCDFHENVHALLQDINRYSKRIFFVVNTNHWMRNQLDLHFDFSEQFVENFCTNSMTVSRIASAIMVRENAIRAELRDEGWEKEQKTLMRRARRCALSNRQNIGASLHAWARQQTTGGNGARANSPSTLKKLVSEYWTILHHLMKYRKTNEQELGRMLGASQLQSEKQRLQFLLGCNVLIRDHHNMLHVNEEIVDILEHQMMTKNYRTLHANV